MNKTTLLLIVFLALITSLSYGQVQAKEEVIENSVLKELRLDLIQNLDDINSNIEALKLSEKANRIIINHMENNLSYNDSLDFYFGNLYPYLVFSPKESTFNYIQQKGMSLISNDSLRLAVSDLYDLQYKIYKSYESIYFVEHYTNYIKPMFIAEFETFKFYRSFKPRNYNEFIKNQNYKRIMSYTADAIETFIFMQSNLKNIVEKLIVDIDLEIDS